MSSRSATVLVIFVIAIVAFCLASVCGAMTGTFTLFPNATDEVGEIVNTSYTEYKSSDSQYHDTGGYDNSHVEENTNDKPNEDSGGILDKITGQSEDKQSNVETTTDSSSSSDSGSSNVETTTDSSSSSDSGSSNVETTTDSGNSNENNP